MKLHPLTLKFSGESSKLEEPFLSYYYRMSIPQLRRILVLGALLYASFSILDALLIPERKYTIWFIRFFIVCPVIIGMLLASFSKSFELYMQPFMAFVITLAGGCIIIMIVIAPIPINYYYYAGLILVFMFGYSFVRIRFLWASLAGWLQVLMYEIAVIWINPLPSNVLINNNFFLISANVLGMVTCYSIELYARREFFLTHQLEIEKENVSKINQELEARVEKRTAEYQTVNQALEQEISGHKQAEFQRKAALEALRESEDRYRALVENASDAVFRTDNNGYFTFVNASTIRLTGYEEKEIVGKHYQEFIRSDSRDEAVRFFGIQFVKKLQNTYSEYPIITKNGDEVWLGQNTQLIVENGKVTGFQAVSRDITERKRLEKEVRDSEERYRELSIIDDLTQLYNSRHFYNQLKMEIDRLERHEYPLTLLLLDLDNFKIFNDTYGHIEGDQVLFRLGQVIKRCLRKEDSAYRYGGEEFTIILPMTIKEEAVVIAERIREEFKKESFSPVPEQTINLTISIGLAQYQKKEPMKAFVNRADHFMYQSKKNGKDRTSFEKDIIREHTIPEVEYLKRLADNGGPTEDQYEELAQFHKSLNMKRKQGIMSNSDVLSIWKALPDAFYTTDTMQGHVILKPYGYAGDFVIIERIYDGWLSPRSHLVNWDRFFHNLAAARAVLNRKKYFIDMLHSLQTKNTKCDVLNIGCGPSQDIVEFLSEAKSQIFFECVDYDKNAIEYSYKKVKEKGFLNNVEFYRDNALKFRPSKQYDLIWSAGLFDYLDEKTFKMLLISQLAFIKTGGELVVGNFSLNNPSRDSMECGNWFLYHRTPEELIKIALECGIPRKNITVKSEPLGVNLFLHISQ
jgi:diguanylate cyclase (GGDEF)-like protein/PAS domain S-box-containing protein